MDLLSTAGVAIGLFVATNLDDAFLLVGWFARGRPSGRQVVVGQYLGIGLLTVVSVLLGAAVVAVASGWVRYLGLLPLAIGLRGLMSIARGGQESESEAPAAKGILAVTAVTIASGADNVSVYTPVFAAFDAGQVAVTALVFLILTGLWCLGARALVDHPRYGAPLRHHGPLIASLALVMVGVAVLLGI